MCRNIKTLYNFDPPATETEIHEAALQFVRKISGFHTPSQANATAFTHAVTRIASDITQLLRHMKTATSPKNRDAEVLKLRKRAEKRFGPKTQ